VLEKVVPFLMGGGLLRANFTKYQFLITRLSWHAVSADCGRRAVP